MLNKYGTVWQQSSTRNCEHFILENLLNFLTFPTYFGLYVSTKLYLTRELIWHKPIFHNALKDGTIAKKYIIIFEKS